MLSRLNNTAIGPNPTRSDSTVDFTPYSLVPNVGPMAIVDIDNTTTTDAMTETSAAPTDLTKGARTSQHPTNNSASCTRLQHVGAGQPQEVINQRITKLMVENEELQR